jgi:hypothetical protein
VTAVCAWPAVAVAVSDLFAVVTEPCGAVFVLICVVHSGTSTSHCSVFILTAKRSKRTVP